MTVEMAQWLRATVALPEVLPLDPSTQAGQLTLLQEIWIFLWELNLGLLEQQSVLLSTKPFRQANKSLKTTAKDV